MAPPYTSLGQMYADQAADDAGRAHALMAAAAARNNSLAAAAASDGRVAALTAAAAAQNNSMVAAQKSNELPLKALMALIEQMQGRMWVMKDFEKRRGEACGSGKCPGIVQFYGGLPQVRHWFEGPKVRGLTVIPYGTVVATFVDGIYPNWEHGNHVAIYMRQDPVLGVRVFDQWTGHPAEPRWMPFMDKDGVIDRSDNGSALSIVLTPKTN